MSDPNLTLYAATPWESPWVFHVMIALEEKRLPYTIEEVPIFPMPPDRKKFLQDKAIVGKVPVLVHDDLWINESLAISEYLAERFPAPDHPRLFPADLGERAHARAVMSMLRTSMMGLRGDRPTTSVFGAPVSTPMSAKGKADADELVRIASRMVGDKPNLFGEWCIADADLALMLMRLVANKDPVPPALEAYTRGQWARASVQKYLDKLR